MVIAFVGHRHDVIFQVPVSKFSNFYLFGPYFKGKTIRFYILFVSVFICHSFLVFRKLVVGGIGQKNLIFGQLYDTISQL
jgi:hypothetical protein